jgi:hypothetical protein
LLIAIALAVASAAVADNARTGAQLDCDTAAYAQYKKDLDALYEKIGSRPITVDEVMTDRHLTEAYCLKQAACYADGGSATATMGRDFRSCLDTETQEYQRQLGGDHIIL